MYKIKSHQLQQLTTNPKNIASVPWMMVIENIKSTEIQSLYFFTTVFIRKLYHTYAKYKNGIEYSSMLPILYTILSIYIQFDRLNILLEKNVHTIYIHISFLYLLIPIVIGA